MYVGSHDEKLPDTDILNMYGEDLEEASPFQKGTSTVCALEDSMGYCTCLCEVRKSVGETMRDRKLCAGTSVSYVPGGVGFLKS